MDVNGNDNSPEWGWCKHPGCAEPAEPVWFTGGFPDDPDLLLCYQHTGAYVGALREAADLAIRGFRRWKREQGRRGNRYEAEHGLTDLGQGISDLDSLLQPHPIISAADASAPPYEGRV